MQESKSGRNRGLRWALGLSLALNLLIVGAMAGAAYRHVGGPDGHSGDAVGSRGHAAAYVMALPRDDRRAMKRALRSSRDGDAGADRKATRRENNAAMLAALRAEPFDLTAVGAVLSTQRDALMASQGRGEAAWLQVVGAMDPAKRADYADTLEKLLTHRPDRDKRD